MSTRSSTYIGCNGNPGWALCFMVAFLIARGMVFGFAFGKV